MSYKVGSTVVVLSLGRKRGVVVDAGHGGRYRVQIENATVSCRERDLAEPPKEGTRKKTRRANPDETPRQAIGNAPAGRIDLHGLTVDEAIARVVEEIDQAIRRGADRLEVVHGKGSGRIRNALHRELASLPVVASFRLDPRNAGVTWIFL